MNIEKEFSLKASEFRMNGDIEKAQEMEMKILKLQHLMFGEENKDNINHVSFNYKDAGKQFEKDGTFEKALDCYLQYSSLQLKIEKLENPIEDGAKFNRHTHVASIFLDFTNLISRLEELNLKELADKYRIKKSNFLSNSFGGNHILVANEYWDLAKNYLKSNNLSSANLMLKSLEIEESQTDKCDFMILYKCEQILKNVKDVLTKDGLISIYLKAIHYEKLKSGEKSGNLLDYYEKLSEIYSNNGETEKAGEMKSLADSVRPPPDYSKLYLEALQKGKKLEEEGIIENAVECYLEGMKYRYLSSEYKDQGKMIFHVDSLEMLIKKIYQSKDMERYIQLKEKKINVMISLLGENHDFLQQEYFNFEASLLRAKYDNLKIMEIRRKQINILIALNGENHLELVNLYERLALALQTQEEYDEAVDFYKKAIKVEITNNGNSTAREYDLYKQIITNYEIRKDYDNALVYSFIALEKKVSKYGEFHPENKAIYRRISELYRVKGELTKKDEYSEKEDKC
jgi:hypothetical protein